MTHRVGSWMFDDLRQPTRHGSGFIAIDVAVIAEPGEFNRRVGELIDEIHAAPTADGVKRLLVPGEREWSNARQAEAAKLPADVREKLAEAARESSLNPTWLR